MLYRNVVTVFLEHRGKVLLMKRGLHKEIAPGAWSSIAGHIEGEEINNPFGACLREIEEETGLKPEQVLELRLSYVIFNKLKEEIIINHMFFGRVSTSRVVANDEGELYWVSKEAVAKRMEISAIRVAIEDYYNSPFDGVRVAVVRKEEPYLVWNQL